MHEAECLIALPDGLNDHAESEDIRKLLEAHRLAFHLAPHRIGTLGATFDQSCNTVLAELAGKLPLDFTDDIAVPLSHLLEALRDDAIGIGVEFLKRQALELLAHLEHADTAG